MWSKFCDYSMSEREFLEEMVPIPPKNGCFKMMITQLVLTAHSNLFRPIEIGIGILKLPKIIHKLPRIIIHHY